MAGWTPKDYTPFFLYEEPTHTEKEIRAEYSRLRDILVKRAKRLRKAGFENRARYIEKHTPKLSSFKGLVGEMAGITNYLAEMHYIYESDAYNLTGINRLQKEIYEATGYKIPVSDILDFDDYMKSYRLSKYRFIVDTNKAVRLYYTEYQEIGGTFTNFYEIFTARKKN